jgi:hypothetical protein
MLVPAYIHQMRTLRPYAPQMYSPNQHNLQSLHMTSLNSHHLATSQCLQKASFTSLCSCFNSSQITLISHNTQHANCVRAISY